MAQSAESSLAYDVALIDFHGTLTNKRGQLVHALNKAYQEVAGRYVRREEFKEVFNRDEGVSVSDALRSVINGGMPLDARERLLKVYHRENDRTYIPKHTYLVKMLRELGVMCVILSNGTEGVIREVLGQWGLAKHFEEIYGRGAGSILSAAGVKTKPNPEAIDYVIGDLRKRGHSIKRGRVLMLGDYQDDIGAGNNTGVHTAFLVTGPNQRPEYYDMRPTYTLLDSPHLQNRSLWIQQENVYDMHDLPDIVAGRIK